jgi:hypothetical protein
MFHIRTIVLVLALVVGAYFLTTGLILASNVDPVELIDFAWYFGAISLMAGVVYRQFLRAQTS